VGSRCYENKARREWWSLHIEAWQRSGLSRRRYCRSHRLSEDSFRRWLRELVDPNTMQIRGKIALERRLKSRRPRHRPVSRDRNCRAARAYWAMHVEALNWSGMSAAHYAAALDISEHSLCRWRNLIEAEGAPEDWRALLHPSARAKISTSAIVAAKESGAETVLTVAPNAEPGTDGRSNRRHFTDEQKLAIVLECERPGASVSAVARAHQLATSALFRWRNELGYGRKEKVKLAPVASRNSDRRHAASAVVLHDLIPVPDGMDAVDLPDGRRVFAPAGTDPAAVRRHIAEHESVR